MQHLDYIVVGAGCSGRSLAVRLLPHLREANKRLLLVDKLPKKGNDKTWCFWEGNPDIFEQVVHKKWDCLSFASSLTNQELDIHPYQYKMIRSEDFYAYTDEKLAQSSNVSILHGNVENLYAEKEKAYVVIDGETFSADYVFSSIPQIQPQRPERYQYMLQHFLGWVIETEDAAFDDRCATLMDFRTSQHEGTSFVYVLPLTPGRALVEYTVFSKLELKKEEYAAALKQYISERLHCGNYVIKEREYGVIPMSDHPVKRQQGGRIVHLGTAGGFTKGSTGYTFQFIQKHTAAIAAQLQKSGIPYTAPIFPKRFRTYDATLLHLLDSGRLSGEEIFSAMFQKNHATQILKFLDNQTSLMEEIRIFWTLQKKEFALALLNRTLKIIKSGTSAQQE